MSIDVLAIRRTVSRHLRHARVFVIAGLLLIQVGRIEARSPATGSPSFDREVMAVLSQAGCNAGLCHGNKNGKGGFRLSLRGQDPAADYRALTREQMGRRIDPFNPADSLMLLKPTGRVAHEGGVRLTKDSANYRIVLDWIAAGAVREEESPELIGLDVTPREAYLDHGQDELTLRVEASFADGSSRDVTELCVYEASTNGVRATDTGRVVRVRDGESTVVVRYLQRQSPVRVVFLPPADDFAWDAPSPSGYIDEKVFAKLRRLRVNPSPICDDHVFLRRLYLDLLGVTPPASEAREFVSDRRPDKRAALIDKLLARPEMADHWALKWSDLLRNEEKVLDQTGVERFHAWIRNWIADDQPLDRFVAELVTGEGSTYDHPPANYYRALRDPLERGETTARLFLGYRLQCARCHNHPFDRWTQDDYYSWAGLFARIDYKIVDNKRKDKFDKHEFVGEQIVRFTDKGEVTNARTGRDADARFLDTDGESLGGKVEDPRLERLADWLTDRGNRQFARTMVNLIWYHVVGRGLVEPIDDFRVTNPPVNPPLLEALTDDFVAEGFRLRPLLRRILNSHTYQASSEPNVSNRRDESNFSHAIVRRLTAEQLLDAQCRFLDTSARFAGYPVGLRAGQLPGVRRVRKRKEAPSTGDRFLSMFGKPERLLSCECERSNETTLAQAFLLVGGDGVNRGLEDPGNRLHRLVQDGRGDEEIVDQLYWEALSRAPTSVEREAMSDHLKSAEDRLAALRDVAWALLNSKEFVFRH